MGKKMDMRKENGKKTYQRLMTQDQNWEERKTREGETKNERNKTKYEMKRRKERKWEGKLNKRQKMANLHVNEV